MNIYSCTKYEQIFICCVLCTGSHIVHHEKVEETLSTHYEAVQRDMRAPVVFAHKHIITSLGIQGNPECGIINFIKCKTLGF